MLHLSVRTVKLPDIVFRLGTMQIGAARQLGELSKSVADKKNSKKSYLWQSF